MAEVCVGYLEVRKRQTFSWRCASRLRTRSSRRRMVPSWFFSSLLSALYSANSWAILHNCASTSALCDASSYSKRPRAQDSMPFYQIKGMHADDLFQITYTASEPARPGGAGLCEMR